MRREGQDSGAKIGSTGVRAFEPVDNPEGSAWDQNPHPDIEYVYKVKLYFYVIMTSGTENIIL